MRSFIYIAVMNYLPTMEFSHPLPGIAGHVDRARGWKPCEVEEETGEGVMGPRKQAGGQRGGTPQGETEAAGGVALPS